MAAGLMWATRAATYLRISVPFRAFSSVVKDLKYVDSHEWAKVDGNLATIGITDHAQDHLVMLCMWNCLKLGSMFHRVPVLVLLRVSKQPVTLTLRFRARWLKSMKNSAALQACVQREYKDHSLDDTLDLNFVNASPYEKGWIIKVEMSSSPSELNSLMDSKQYSKFCKDEKH